MRHQNNAIYILLTQTGSLPTQVIGLFSRYPYNHVSISLDPELTRLYSFGRLRPQNPWIGGFVHENIRSGTFARFPATSYCLLKLPVTAEQYAGVEREIERYERDASRYRYNYLGVVGAAVGVPVGSQHRCFCSQFVARVLDAGSIRLFEKCPDLITPEDFRTSTALEYVSNGLLREFSSFPHTIPTVPAQQQLTM